MSVVTNKAVAPEVVHTDAQQAAQVMEGGAPTKQCSLAARLVVGLRWRIRAMLPWNLDFEPTLHVPFQVYGNKGASFGIVSSGLNEKSIVYSFGVGEDISFDLALIEKFGVSVYAFDPTPKSLEWLSRQKLPDRFHIQAVALGDRDGTMIFYPPENPDHVSHSLVVKKGDPASGIEVQVKRLTTIFRELGHQEIDVLKMDIEGAEYGVLRDLVRSDLTVRQLVVEFHHRYFRFGAVKTRLAIRMIKRHRFQLFCVSKYAEEFCFLKT